MMATLTKFQPDLLRERTRFGLRTHVHNAARRFVQATAVPLPYRSQYRGFCIALMGALLLAILPAQANSAAWDKLKDNARLENSVTAGTRQTVLVVQEGPGRVVLFSAADPSRRKIVKVGEKPHEIELTPDGRTAFISNFGLLEVNHQVGTPGTTISVLDIVRGAERAKFRLPAGATAPHGLKLRPPKYRELFTNAEAGNEMMIVFDANTGRVLRSFALPRGVHNFLFNADGTAVLAYTTTNEVLRIDPARGAVTASVKV